MLLYTNKSNNVFDFVDEKFVDWDISPERTPSRAGLTPTGERIPLWERGCTLLKAALAAGVAFMPGEPFFPEPDKNPGHLRLNFSHIDPARLDEGRLATVVRQVQAAEAA